MITRFTRIHISSEFLCQKNKYERYRVINVKLGPHFRAIYLIYFFQVMESAFGNLDALSSLMNEFFSMFPGAKSAYSVASALSGVYGLQQFSGISHVTSTCKWIPFFQGVFYCHDPVKVHLDVLSTLQDCIVAVYNNDDGIQLPQPYRAHWTFDLSPNSRGFVLIQL